MNRIGWAAALAVLMCVPAWGKSFKEQDTLEPDEGILATTLTCGSPVTGVQLFRAGKPSGGFWGPLKGDGSIGCTKGIQLMRLKAGQYYVGQMYSVGNNKAVPEEKSPHFTVEAGKVNYSGDLYAGNVALENVDQETLVRVAGRPLTALNHEPQAREALEQKFASVLARYPFLADASMTAPVPMAATPEDKPGTMRGVMTIGAPRWKRGEDGQPRICTKTVRLPKGTKLAPGEDFACEGEFVTPEEYVAKEHPKAALNVVTPPAEEDSTLVITFSASSP